MDSFVAFSKDVISAPSDKRISDIIFSAVSFDFIYPCTDIISNVAFVHKFVRKTFGRGTSARATAFTLINCTCNSRRIVVINLFGDNNNNCLFDISIKTSTCNYRWCFFFLLLDSPINTLRSTDPRWYTPVFELFSLLLFLRYKKPSDLDNGGPM